MCMHTLRQVLLVFIVSGWSSILLAEADIEVFIEGIDKALEQNVRLFISIEQQKDHVLLDEGRLRRLHQKAPQEIAHALQPYGYYRPLVQSELSKSASNRWKAVYQIDPGPAITIAEFNLWVNQEAQADAVFRHFLNNLPLKSGDVFLHQKYESIKTGLLRLASERGYFDARFTEHRVEIDLQMYEARVQLFFMGGQRYVFGDVNISGDVLEQELLQRYIGFDKGSPYELDQLIGLQHALNDSDYFQTVEISPGQPDSSTLEMPVNLTLMPRKDNLYSFGLGFGTDTGVRTRLGWEKPLINQQGHKFNSELKVSEIGNSLSAFYTLPVLNPRTDSLVFSIGLVNEETDTSDSRLQTLGVSLNRIRGEWRETLSLEYQQEDFTVADISDSSSLLLPGIRWSRIWGSGLVYTLDGIRLDISLQGAAEKLLSDVDFFQLNTGIKFIQRIGAINRFIVRGSVGSTWTDEFDALPSSVRFFAGGAQSVRGYAYKSLGPEDDDGDVEGGRHLMVGSIELEHSFSGKWGVALFVDSGNAINDFNDELQNGAGFGLRWKSPVGPVRIDLASALSRRGDPWRIHINIGPDL